MPLELPDQCGLTTIHLPHDACPGLDGTEVAGSTHDPLAVVCPSCTAPVGVACTIRNPLSSDGPDAVHPDRIDAARIESVRRGTCKACGQPLYQLTDPLDTFHPPALPVECPPHPDPSRDWNAYARWVNDGGQERHPGDDNFVPAPVEEPTPRFETTQPGL